MAAAMNGMALHGGVIPYSGTFLVFSDYCRPAIRLAALMGERVIHVMTHDSIGLGEDGPTHQPVEHLAALARDPEPAGVPSLRRGRDGRMLAARARACATRPSVLALTRQNLPQLRLGHEEANRCAAGAYEIVPADEDRRRVAVRHRLGGLDRGRGAQVPARARRRRARRLGALLRAVPRAAGRRAAGRSSAPPRSRSRSRPRCGRAGTRSSARDGAFVGMTSFGASAPYKELYKHFGITPEEVAEAALGKLGKT